MSNQEEIYDVLDGNSLFKLRISRDYIGEVNLLNANRLITDTNSVLRLRHLSNNTKCRVYMTQNEQIISAVQIQGITFDASVKAQENQVDMFKPLLGGGGSEGADTGNPVMPFQIRPPKEQKMWAFCTFRNGRLANTVLLISTQDKGSNEIRLFRPPIPNCSLSDAHMCVGNITGKNEIFTPDFTHKFIRNLIHGGFNNDWWCNTQLFQEKNGIMHNVWTSSVGLVDGCKELTDNYPSYNTIIRDFTNDPVSRHVIGRMIIIENSYRHSNEQDAMIPPLANTQVNQYMEDILEEVH